MNNFLLWVGGLLVVLLCTLFAVPHFIDWNGYRGAFEEEASRILGREVRVAGRVNLRILPTPFVRFEKVRLSDQEGVTGEPFFRADDFTLWLAPGALLRGALEANRIELHRPILKLRLNAEGGGNWQTFSLNNGSLPFVLSEVALQSVSLSDGAVSIDDPDGAELVRMEAIEGEVTATSLTGPFRFRGQANWNNEPRTLRLATAAAETDGSMRFKLNVAVPKSGNAYVLDGRISDLTTKPKLDGALSGSLQVADALRTGTTKAAAPVPIDLKAQIIGDADGVKLTEIAMAFDQDGSKPQSLTGTVDAQWRGTRGINANLISRWLDIDRILGWAPASLQSTITPAEQSAGQEIGAATKPVSGGLAPLTILRQMSTGIAGLMPASLPAQVTIAADAVTLAGDTVNNVRFGLERSGEQLRLKEFRAGFPGSTRVEASGLFPSAADPAAFEGDVVLRGANLGRFMSWAGIAAQNAEARNDGAFSLRALLVTTAQSVAFRDITADLAGTVIGGAFQDDWSKRRRIDVQLEGSTIDLSNLAPGSLDFRAWRALLQKSKVAAPPIDGPTGGVPKPAPAALPTFLQRWLDPAEGDFKVQVRAGRLIDGGQDLRDVALTAAMTDGRLTLSNLHFQSATNGGQAGASLDVDAEGEVSDLNSQPTGVMRGWVVAQDGAAVSQLMTLLGLTPEALGGADQGRLLAPSRIAWTARFGNKRGGAGAANVPGSASNNVPSAATVNSAPGASANAPATAMDLTLDGALLGRRLMAVLRLDGGLDGWRTAPLDATLTLDGPDFPRLVQLFKLDDLAVGPVTLAATTASDVKPGDVRSESFGQGRLSVKIVGRSASELLADIRFNDDGVDWSFTGRASALGGPLSADGEVRITAADLERAIAQAGFGRNAGLANVIVDGSVDLFVKDGNVRLASRGLTLNGAALFGDLTLASIARNGLPDLRRVDARLSTADASIPRLLELLLDPRATAKSVNTDDIVWSKVAFDLARFASVDANLRLGAQQMSLNKGVELQNATLEVRIDKGRVDIAALDGAALGGRLTSKWSIVPVGTTAGAIVAGSATLTGAQIPSQSQRSAEPPKTVAAGPSGTVNITMTMSGQGLSPAAVVSRLSGNGMIDVADGRIHGISPANVRNAIEAAMAGKVDLTADALERTVQKSATGGILLLGTRNVDVSIIDGAVRIAPLIVATPDGQATNRTTIDLASLKFDIEWRLDLPAEGASSGQTSQPWPRVSVVHLGHLGESDLSVQRISVQALAREITVRKMERDVAELERLRRLDEERIRVETERLKAAEAAKDALKLVEPTAGAIQGAGTTTSGAAAPIGRLPLGGPDTFGAVVETQAAPLANAAPVNDAAADEAKRRAATRAAAEAARRPRPDSAFDPFRQGASP
jgi:uncharacterized protein involved in outer membrane biogenesis